MVMNELENFTGDHKNYTTLFTYIPINVVRKFVFKHFTTALTKSIFDCNMHRLALEDVGASDYSFEIWKKSPALDLFTFLSGQQQQATSDYNMCT